MADYRRIVSYLYQYKNGRRGENVGFVRVQKAQDRLKIVLNVKDKKQSEDLMLKIYFYIHKNGKLYGIFVDNIVLKEGNCEYKRAFLEREIFKNGEKIDDMHGMLLYYSREMSYGTEWDDKKIEVEQFILEQKRGKDDRGDSREEDRIGSSLPFVEREKKDTGKEVYDRVKSIGALDKKEIEIKEKGRVLSDDSKWNKESREGKSVSFLLSNHSDSKKEEQRVTDKIREQMKPETKMKIDSEKMARGEKEENKKKLEERLGTGKRNLRDEFEFDRRAVEREREKEKRKMEMDKANINKGGKKKIVPIKESRKERQVEKMYSESDTLQKAQEKFIKNSESIQSSGVNEIIGNIDLIKNGKGIENSDKNKGVSSDKDFKVEKEEKKVETKSSISMIHMQEKGEKDEIEIMLRDYPKILDIESEDLNECVKIMPRDIGKMDTVNWWLRSNRLLLYRFEQYHYLLLGKHKNQDGSWQRVVGIPGIFDSKERYLASLFQFYCFIPTESKKYKTGSFGYWVTPIR